MMDSTRPSSFSHLLHDRGVRFAAGLAVVVAIPVAVLFYFQFKSLDDIEETSSVVLRQLSRDTADSVTREIEEALKRPHIDLLLRPGQQARLNPPDFGWLDTVFGEGMAASEFIEELWFWSETGTGVEDRFFVFDRASLHTPVSDGDRRFRESPTRHQQVVPKARALGAERRAIVAFPAEIDGRKKYVQLQLGFEGPNRERVTRLLGFMVDAEELRTVYFPSVIERRLASVQQPIGFPPLDLYMTDAVGSAVTPSGRPPASTVYVDERTFPLVFFDRELLEYAAPYEQSRETWRVRTSYGAQTIPEIVTANTRPQMALMIVLALVMAGGVFFVASAAAREVRVAELKSNFVASVSHDLKTPLALIQLFAETLELGRVRNPDRVQEYYRIINTEARKLTRLIENILDFSRMEAGLRPYRPAPVDIGALTRQVLADMESQFNQARFAVHTQVDPDLPPVNADEDAVEQAIENLLANAMKYSGEARDIDVHVGRANSHVCVSVKDHGIGISRREQKKIFRKFYRIDRGLGGGPQGCGLGLAIVDHTMRGHGGFVRVDSEPEHGSTFTLHFPISAGRDLSAGGALKTPEASAEGDRDETDSGDRGRTADVARSA
ncbi:MAG TPA: HAMP domain-containing sensor histidine kinase [Vicinamibacterales bacterium]|nr:HAMP domain-containing sensor histidine kinase [Vicinamibacterales bacterium]